MWLEWFPWKYFVSKGAQSRGFLDPVMLMTRLARFSQPSEVAEPIELLRAGVVFHARGLVNTRAIQHNLDWVWPYWVERQFDPRDESFIPRAFSITHVNLTHRNWTGVGLPGYQEVPIVDPRGLVTPLLDGWSLDFWILDDQGEGLFPSRLLHCGQKLEVENDLAVVTECSIHSKSFSSRVSVRLEEGAPRLFVDLKAVSEQRGWLAVSIRPYNPEGVSFVHGISVDASRRLWRVDGGRELEMSEPAERAIFSRYDLGDVISRLGEQEPVTAMHCPVGLATAAALYRMEGGRARELRIGMKLDPPARGTSIQPDWGCLAKGCRLKVPDARMQSIYYASKTTLLLLSPQEVYPGPFTYKRFWFRDAAFILHALVSEGHFAEAERAIEIFRTRQSRDGYFLSQEGEWDSNGEALWIMGKYCELSGARPKEAWRSSIVSAARWIARKRLRRFPNSLHSGLLPAGFSAEHLGPNDYYYWDDFWGVAGLRSAAGLMERYGAYDLAREFNREAQSFMEDIEASLAMVRSRRGLEALPASPYRRMDAGAIGSVVCSYPLGLLPARDPRLMRTIEFILDNCMFNGGFFQEMIHSGINAYLTLHVAQALLRAGDQRFFFLVQAVADLASSTGQWPEAVHPRTLGGCMGDGQHSWASSEWILMLRSMFVRVEGSTLILASGIPFEWLEEGACLAYGPTQTPFGSIEVRIEVSSTQIEVVWTAEWRGPAPRLEIRLPGYEACTASGDQSKLLLPRRA